MTTERYQELEREFKVIRDERGVAQNTAVRIGTAFLDLLRYCMLGEFDEIIFNKVLNKPTFMKGLITLGSIIFGEYAEGLQGGIITEEGVAELKDLWVREHAKIGDGSIHRDEAGRVIPALEVKGDSTFTGNLSSPEFVSDFLGGLGWAIQKKEFVNSAGVIEYKYTLEIDNAVIRNTLRVFEMIISQLLGENDNRIFAAMMEVHHYDPETGKVWLSTNNGRWFMNFRKDDCIMVQQYQAENDVVSGGDGYITKSYELLITDVGSGGETDENGDRLDWVTFTNFATQMSDSDGKPFTPEMLIKEGDTFTRVDNLTDPDRKGIVTMMTVGNNTPYMDVRYGLKTDPKNNLKSRIGNLEGIRSDIFGWLEGFGIYTTNYYGIGHFINAQTGENVQARQEMTLERFHSFYQETTYNISDEDNFLTNGFFQKGLESWRRCEADGTPVADEPDSQLLGTVEESGEAMMPLMINGQMLSVANRRVADITEMDGIKVLHLLGMGVSQAFSDIKPKGSHKEMESDSQESTEVVDVDDFMYMGVRILPVTRGTLYAKFIRTDGSWTGWETVLEDSFDWLSWQYREIEANRWEWEGSGKFVLSYSGECYIRFVALTTDAVANAKVDYQTHIEQTSRRITLQAIKTDAQHQTAMAEIQLQHDAVMDVVTTNKSTSDTMLSTILGITVNPDGTYNIPDALKGENMATWRINTNSHIMDIAAHWDENDQLIGYATQEMTWNRISSEVASGVAASQGYTDQLKGMINTDVLKDASGNFGYSTWKTQTDNAIASIAGKWDSNGQLIGYSTSQQTADAISSAVYGLAKSSEVTALNESLTRKINSDIETVNETIQSVNKENDDRAAVLATWQKQTDARITAIAGKWDSNGNLIGYSTTTQMANAISSAVYGLAKSSEVTALNESLTRKINSDIETVNETIQSVNKENDDRAAVLATWQKQTDARITAIAGKWDSNGNLIGYSTTTQMANAISSAVYGLAKSSEVTALNESLTRKINSDIETVNETIQSVNKENDDRAAVLATWQKQTDARITAIAGKWDSNGNLIGYSTTTQMANAISSAVYGLAKSSELSDLNKNLTQKINSDIARVNETIQGVDTENDERAAAYATWKKQTDQKITAIAGKWDSNGNLIGYSTTTQMANAISSAVYGLAKSSELSDLNKNLTQKINSDIARVNETIQGVDTENDERAAAYATWKKQTDQKITAIAGKWDSNGNLIGYSTTTQMANAISSAVYGLAKSSELSDLNKNLTQKINSDIARVNETIQGVDTENDERAAAYATWKEQTDKKITAIAGKWDSNGNLIGYSTTTQMANAISSAVYGLAKSSELSDLNKNLTQKINSDIGTVNETIQSVNKENDDRAAAYATWKEQTDKKITAIAGKWDSNGQLIGYSTSQQTADSISAAVVNLASKASVESVQNSINTLNNTTIPGLVHDISVAYGLAGNAKDTADKAYAYGTTISQLSNSVSILSNRFNADGSLKNTSGLVTGNGDFATLFSAALRSDGTVMKKAEMGTYVQKDGDGYITGAFIDAARIDFRANLVQVKNQDGDITFQLDEDGNLKVMGTIEGGQIIDDIKVGSKGNKMEIYCDERSGNSYRAGIRGWDDSGNKVLDLGFFEFGTSKVRASLNFGSGFYSESGFAIADYYILNVGFKNNKIHVTAPYEAWPVGKPSDLGCAKGEMYVDNDGYVKIYNKDN